MTDADAAYQALGFSTIGVDRMQLDPARSDKWCRHAGRWRLRKHVDEKYVDDLGGSR